MLKSRKTVCVLVRYGSHFYEKSAFKRENGNLTGNRGRVRAFEQKSRKTVTKVRYAVRSTKTVPRGKRLGTVRYGTVRTQYGTVRTQYGTVRTRQTDKFGSPSVTRQFLTRFPCRFSRSLPCVLNASKTRYQTPSLKTREYFSVFVQKFSSNSVKIT
jgi:hypothetical protein